MPVSNETTITHNLSLMARGNYEQVHTNAIAMIKANINDPVPYLLLGKLCVDHNNLKKADELYEKALGLGKDNPYTRIYYAQLLTDLKQHVRAREIADTTDLQTIHSGHLCDTLGVIFSRLGFHEKAVKCFQKAVNIDAQPANYHLNLASSLQFLGQFERAKHHYEATLEREPNHFRALSSIVSLQKQTQQHNQLASLLAVYEEAKDDPDKRLHIGHALAKTYEDFGDYPTSLEWLHRAKALKSTTADAMSYRDIFDALIHMQSLPDQTNAQGHDNKHAPIFIVGLPRTGTTLVDRIVSSHPDVSSGGELNAFAEIVKRYANTASHYVLDKDTLEQVNRLPFDKIGKDYLAETQALYRDAERCTDKMPLNFFYAGLINKALPNARIIALRRGALDSCLSNYRQLLTSRHSYYDYTYSLETTADFYKQYDALMTHWRTTLPADRFMEIHYEDIVYQQETQTRQLLAFCGLSWNEQCMRFHENDAPVATASSVQVRQPLYSGSIGRWKRYGNLIADLKRALVGYD